MTVTASMVKELRNRSGAGMMECKKALVETDGDIEAAIEHLRKSGVAKAAKKAGRIAAEGRVFVVSGALKAAMIEINSETDFVAKDSNFSSFCEDVGSAVLQNNVKTVNELSAVNVDSDASIEDKRLELIATMGENISVRRFICLDYSMGSIESYSHGQRIGVLVKVEGADSGLARNIAMHIAATNPMCIDENQLDAALLEKEEAIYLAQAKESRKPDNIISKMVQGRIRKFKAEVTLVGQPYVKDPAQTVGELLVKKNAKVLQFERYELGEGIEKKQDNFAEEVMAQAQSAGKN